MWQEEIARDHTSHSVLGKTQRNHQYPPQFYADSLKQGFAAGLNSAAHIIRQADIEIPFSNSNKCFTLRFLWPGVPDEFPFEERNESHDNLSKHFKLGPEED
jgi:hypothetical protein